MMGIKINSSHVISVAPTGALALERLAWRQVDANRIQVPEVLAIYESEILLARDLISDCIGISVHRGDINNVGDMAELFNRLLPLCTAAAQDLSSLRERKKQEYENRKHNEAKQ
ncbi:DUF5405 family protein [Erwinia billingiae]|uniref:DUF5405 family protein n=1 Tax=Erwinia billingiae TaxID=182337 RepID=UPI00320B21A3